MAKVQKHFDFKTELNKLNRICSALPEDKLELCAGLIRDAAFMAEQLELLRDYISTHGWSEEYKNGANQFGKKSCSEADAYIKLQKLYASCIKQLSDLLPDEPKDTDELMDFLK